MHIAIIGGTIYGNRGAEAMVTTTIGRIRERYPEAEFTIFSYFPERDSMLIHDSRVHVQGSTPKDLVFKLFPGSLCHALCTLLRLNVFTSFLPANVRALARSRALICVCGVAFMDSRLKYLPFNVLTIWPAMLLGVPVFKFAQALGPCRRMPNRLLAKYFLPRCTRIFARGSKTEENLYELGLRPPLLDRAGDIAFLNQEKDSLSKEAEDHVVELCGKLRRDKEAGHRVVVLCPSAVVASKATKEKWNYYQLMATITTRLLNKGFSVLLLPNATRKHDMDRMQNNDLPIIESVIRYMIAFGFRSERLHFVSEDVNIKGIKQLIAASDFLVVSRFHAMVVALGMLKPTMVMGWGHKYLEVMEHFQLEQYVLDYKENDPDAVIEMVEVMVAHEQLIISSIEQHLPAFEKMSWHQFEEFFAMLEKDAYNNP